MTRFTIKNLRETIEQVNLAQAASGSTWFLNERGRNGYQAVDKHYIDAAGHQCCYDLLAGGTSRECAQAAELWEAKSEGYTFPDKKPNRRQAFEILRRVGVDFSANVHSLRYEHLGMLADWAKWTGYRKPQNANGSTARYFFAHLARRFNH